MRQEMIPEINFLIQQLTELRTKFETGISDGKSYAEVKAIYQQMKDLGLLLKEKYQVSIGKDEFSN